MNISFQNKLHAFGLSYEALTRPCWHEPVYKSTYLWCKFFSVISVENYRIGHDHVLNLVQTYLLGMVSQILLYKNYN